MKVCIYTTENEFVNAFDLKREIVARSVFVNAGGEIVLIGAKYGSDRMLHVFDESGTYSHSFGEFFEIPTEMKPSLPQNLDEMTRKRITLPSGSFYFDDHDALVLLNPFKYEIRVYQGSELTSVITHSRKGYRGLAGISTGVTDGSRGGIISYIATPSVIKKGSHLFVFHFNSDIDFNEESSVDVFINGTYQDSYDVKIGGFPLLIDREGFVYCSELTDGGHTICKYAFRFRDN